MRLLFIICEQSIDARVMDTLTRLGAPGYTRFSGAVGSGKNGIREGTPIWPGLNSLVMSAVPEELVPDILESLERMQAERSGRLALKIFSVPAEEYS